jgi:hypothetical protein
MNCNLRRQATYELKGSGDVRKRSLSRRDHRAYNRADLTGAVVGLLNFVLLMLRPHRL